MEITIDIPDELTTILRRTPEELRYDLPLRALAGLVERGLLSTGRAAELARVSRREFLDWCGRWQLRIHRWDDTEVAHDLAYARRGDGARSSSLLVWTGWISSVTLAASA